MMNKIPPMISVADVQRRYSAVRQKVKRAKEPVVILNNGKPDMVLLDVNWYNEHIEQRQKEEEEHLYKVTQQALADDKAGKSVELREGETLTQILERIGNVD